MQGCQEKAAQLSCGSCGPNAVVGMTSTHQWCAGLLISSSSMGSIETAVKRLHTAYNAVESTQRLY
jgi:hypothetical protein